MCKNCGPGCTHLKLQTQVYRQEVAVVKKEYADRFKDTAATIAELRNLSYKVGQLESQNKVLVAEVNKMRQERKKTRNALVPEMLELRKKGFTHQAIADHFGMERSNVTHALNDAGHYTFSRRKAKRFDIDY